MALNDEQKDEARDSLKSLLDEGTKLPIVAEGDLPSFHNVEKYTYKEVSLIDLFNNIFFISCESIKPKIIIKINGSKYF